MRAIFQLYHVENLLFDEMKKISVLYQTNLQLDFNRAGSLKHQHTLYALEKKQQIQIL
jgi:hypothetical protein